MHARLVPILTAVAVVAACNPALDGYSDGVTSSEGDAAPAEDAAVDAPSSAADAGTPDAKVDGAAGVDAAVDAAADASCRANGVECSRGSSCCSGSCNEAQTCVASCLAEGAGGCVVGGSACCAGAYCSAAAGAQCVACLPTGATPETPGDASSCCAHQLFNGKCADN